jgi:hypothetical protein
MFGVSCDYDVNFDLSELRALYSRRYYPDAVFSSGAFEDNVSCLCSIDNVGLRVPNKLIRGVPILGLF